MSPGHVRQNTRQTPARARLVVVTGLWVLGLGSGCVGEAVSNKSGNKGDEPGGSSPGSGGPGAPGSGKNGPTSPPDVTNGACVEPTVRPRILTRLEYINTVSDLLQMDVAPLVGLAEVGDRRFRQGVFVTPLQAESFRGAAEAIAAKATQTAQLERLSPCDPRSGTWACAGEFLDGFAPRALRRPLSAEVREDLLSLFDGGVEAGGFRAGMEWMLAGLLQMPEFLYHHVLGPEDVASSQGAVMDFEMASRLAFFLWNGGPDEKLMERAAAGRLRTTDQIATEVRRLLADGRARRSRDDFYSRWLSLDLLDSVTREVEAFTPEVGRALRQSVLEDVDAVHRTGGGFEALFGGPEVHMNRALADVYGASGANGDDFVPVTAPNRHGLLTHPALMALLAHHDESDPILRGQFVYDKVLCQSLPDPPDDVPDLPPISEDATIRERLEEHKSSPACSACHRLFDPIGLAFENFDHIGRFRTEVDGKKVDTSGVFEVGDSAVDGAFDDGLQALGRFAQSEMARACLASRIYEYATGRAPDESDTCALKTIRSAFGQSGDFEALTMAITTSAPFRSGIR